MTDIANGKTSLVGYIRAFERVNGRTPTEAENREALALVEVVRESNLDPFLVYYLANKKAQDALERVPIETRAVIAEAGMTAKTLAAICEQMDRIEQRADDAAKQPAIPSDLGSQMARLEALLRHGSQAADPFAGVVRYVVAFGAGAGVCELLFAAAFYRWMPPAFDRVGMFVLGLSATAFALLWLLIWPIIRAARRGR